MLKRYIRKNLYNNIIMPKEEADLIQDVWILPPTKRWQLYKFWWHCYIERQQAKTLDLQMRFRELYKELNELRSLEDVHICQQAQVVGMTTTGAAKYKHIVQQLNPTIVVVEEAAEILESHIVTSLASHTKHVILIGDHQQLRPSPTVHMLSVKYDLNVSLFERMIQNGMNYQQLNMQHRMRPEIASLLVPHIYKSLENHDSVLSFENIRGVLKNVFFISHKNCELQESDTRSKVNQHEAKFLIRLCNYFILQNYDPSQITVLTTYSGQLFELKRLSKGILSGIKFTVVDNYQGEENDIILISFVRSNDDGEIGFLKISNRVCVALSRARKGLYGIGNFQLLAEKSPFWEKIVNVLQKNGSIGSHLQLVCQNHPNTNIAVAEEKDFDAVIDGGCTLKCDYRLPCGHTCPKLCHPYDMEHNDIRCLKPCNKSCSEGHICEKICSEECGSCYEPVVRKIDLCGHKITVACYLKNSEIKCTEPTLKILSCGHEMTAECYVKNSDVICSAPCEKILSCDHKCLNLCGEKCQTKCQVECKFTSKFCGHDINDKCFRRQDAEYLINKCEMLCNRELICSHTCKGTCKDCHQGRLHVACFEKCHRKLVCGHKCKSPCSKSCPPCRRPCENWCDHNKCSNKCNELCEKCSEPCGWICPHKKCTRLCSEPCDRVPCDEPCLKLLDCQHPCIGFCGEPCPKLCRICNANEISVLLLTSVNQNDARFVSLEDCDHVFEINFITRWISQKNAANYVINRKTCPSCGTVIRKNIRFGNIIKAINEDIEQIKLYVKALNKKMNNLLPFFRARVGKVEEHIFLPLRNVIMSKTCRSMQELMIIRNFLRFRKIFINIKNYKANGFSQLHKSLVTYIESTISWITPLFQDDYLTASDEQMFELSWELHRVKLADLILRQTPKFRSLCSYLGKAKLLNCIMSYKPFRNDELLLFISEFKIFCEKMGISFSETDLYREQISTVVNLSENHWLKCKNGHIYRLIEYEDTVEKNTCSKCEAKRNNS